MQQAWQDFKEGWREAGWADYFVPVDHKDTHFINFYGSRATGVRIYERAAKVQEGQTHLKRVIAEMGGKDTIIVDKDADLELAADAIVYSAFGFSGKNVPPAPGSWFMRMFTTK